MISKRQIERLPEFYLDPEPVAQVAPRQRMPGQPGYPQAREIERLRHKHVTRIRQLGRR
ncbi:hypothetical protein [Pseudoduganella sp. OTU4001]|uniref:hypothetical protein n=1 Tax=Pseudoduganella sp. OTU4001 TaxID=3043854 RepID=UPI00313E1A54